jgi:hypothetical protein
MSRPRTAERSGRGFLVPILALTALFTADLTATAAPAVPAAPADPIAALLAEFARHPHAHASFTEQTYSRVLTHPLTTTGELYFDAPDRLEKKTLTPAPEDLLVEGENVTVTRGTHSRSFQIGDIPPLRPLLEGLRATLAGDLAGLTARFALSFEPSDAGWLLTLRPLPGELQPLFQRMQIGGRDGRVQSLQIERDRGENSLMKITSAEPP